MLMPDHVVAFLADDRSFVRTHALRYFEESGDARPLTADHLWEAIDRLDPLDALALIDDVARVPQTERSYQRLVQALVAEPANLFDYHVQLASGEIDLELLMVHRDELLGDPRLLPQVREHLEQRLALAPLPARTLWDRLIQHGNAVAHKHAGEFDPAVSERLIESLSRNSDAELIDRALTALRDPAVIDSWNEIFLVQFLSGVRCAAAVDLLIEKLLIDDADILNQRAYEALARIGTIEVVEKIEASYAGKEWGIRLFAREPLHRIKRPASEAALVRLVDGESDPQLQAILLHDLFDIGSMNRLQRARDLIASNPNDPELRDLCAAALATAIMCGVELPEAADWTQRVERDEARSRELRREMNEGFAADARGGGGWGMPRRFDEFGPGEDDWDRGIAIDPLDAIGDGPAMVGVETYRHAAPKVGRNDPCPCGSGKKYKKCHGTAA